MKHSFKFPSMHNLNVRPREVPTGMPAPGTAGQQALNKPQRALIRRFQERMVWWKMFDDRWVLPIQYLDGEPPEKTADVAAGLAPLVVKLDNHVQEWQVWLGETRASVNYVVDSNFSTETDMQIQVLEKCHYLLITVLIAVKRMWELAAEYTAKVVNENAAKTELHGLCRDFLREMFNPNLERLENEYMDKMVNKDKGQINLLGWAYAMQLAYHTYVQMGAVYDVVKEEQKLALREWFDARASWESNRPERKGAKA